MVVVGLLYVYRGMWRGEIRVFLRLSGSCVNVEVYKGGLYNWPSPDFFEVVNLLCECGGVDLELTRPRFSWGRQLAVWMWRCIKEGYIWPGPGFLQVVRLLCECEGVLGSSGRVVNSLDFCLASLKSLGCFYFWCVLSSQWKAVTVNLWILHCQL